jgi:hypothetical protein
LVHLLDLDLELVSVGIELGVLHGELVPLELLELRVAHRANCQRPADREPRFLIEDWREVGGRHTLEMAAMCFTLFLIRSISINRQEAK